MFKVRGFDHAQEIARRENLAYGLSVTDGHYYIGTVEQLEKLPVVTKFDYTNKQDKEKGGKVK